MAHVLNLPHIQLLRNGSASQHEASIIKVLQNDSYLQVEGLRVQGLGLECVYRAGTLPAPRVEARNLEHHFPHALQVKHWGSQHYLS